MGGYPQSGIRGGGGLTFFNATSHILRLREETGGALHVHLFSDHLSHVMLECT